MRKMFIYILLLILSSCVKETEWELSGELESVIVVDAIITDEIKRQSVTISYPIASLNETPLPINGASVFLSNEDTIYQLIEDSGNSGIYYTDEELIAQIDKNYSLLILFSDNVYSSQAYMVKGTLFPELKYSRNDDDELFHINYVASAFETSEPAMWEVIIDWSNVTGYENSNPDDCIKRLMFYTLTTLDVSEIFAPDVESISFPEGSIIDQRRYSLSAEHEEYIRTMLLETDWQGGFFPTENANVSTNMSDGAIGFFGVCALNSLSLIVSK